MPVMIWETLRIRRELITGMPGWKWRPFLMAAAFFLLLPGTNVCRADPITFDFPVDNQKLADGQVQIFQKELESTGTAKKKQIGGIILIDAPPEQVWDTITNWDAMGEYVAGLNYYKTIFVLKPLEDDHPGQFFIEGKLDIPLFNFQYTLDVAFDHSRLFHKFRLLTPEEIEVYNLIGIPVKKPSAGIENIEGYGYITPFAKGKKSVYAYTSAAEYSMPLPEFIENYIACDALIGYLEGVKKRVESQGLYVKPSTWLLF